MLTRDYMAYRPFLTHFSFNSWNYIAIYNCECEKEIRFSLWNKWIRYHEHKIFCFSYRKKKSDEELLPSILYQNNFLILQIQIKNKFSNPSNYRYPDVRSTKSLTIKNSNNLNSYHKTQQVLTTTHSRISYERASPRQ